MAELLTLRDTTVIPAMSGASIAKVERLTEMSLRHLPQVPFVTVHRLHAGQYFRIVTIPAPPPGGKGTVCTGVLVKIPTNLTLIGDVTVYMGEGEEPVHVRGWKQLQGSAGRKQAFLSQGEFTMIMSFATNATKVKEAQAQFTDEVDLLCSLSDTERHDIIVTGE